MRRQAAVFSRFSASLLTTLRTRVAEISMPWRAQVSLSSSYSEASLSVTDSNPCRAISTRRVKFMMFVSNISSSLGSGSIRMMSTPGYLSFQCATASCRRWWASSLKAW